MKPPRAGVGSWHTVGFGGSNAMAVPGPCTRHGRGRDGTEGHWDQARPAGTHPALAPRGALHSPRGWWQRVSMSLSVSSRAGMGGVHGWIWVPFGCPCSPGRDATGDPVAAGSRLPCSMHPGTGSGLSRNRIRTVPGQDQDRAGTVSGLCQDSTGTTPEARLVLYRNSTRTVPGQYLNHTWTVPGPCQDWTKTGPEPCLDRTGTGTAPDRAPRSRSGSLRYCPAPIPGSPRSRGRAGRPLSPPRGAPAASCGHGRDGAGRGGGGSGAR